ncbi:SMI1/KNR4 family protein [Bradyrhizobium sp. AUGA SZCCT0169]|uniref:SMI1/KNR4 family protein n=1 Tax=Bradyrhizobium sp. AUGA SZCCT0169 TaxID=2807663 RepID=UPI001BAB4281|nr:SMI1/KNR4 family protein [Bradyrhizobium sp. AUGA SZCCT0169]MBR1250439.1 SMI1/KNR4 family protein [Bradyrhizobium sp. AUGA SZCCT0169]
MSESDLLQAEEELGARLPKDYREFLAQHGEDELQVRLADDSAELCFYRPTDLATQRSNLFNFIALTEDDPENIDAYFRGAIWRGGARSAAGRRTRPSQPLPGDQSRAGRALRLVLPVGP